MNHFIVIKMKKSDLIKTQTLKEALTKLFNVNVENRQFMLDSEAMTGRLAQEYYDLGKISRKETYKKIVEDFKNRTDCYGYRHPDMRVGTILDVGCGPGFISLELGRETNGKIIGMDISEDMLHIAKSIVDNKTKNVEFISCSVYDITKKIKDKKSINYVVCRNALHRFKNPEKAIKEMYSALSKGGMLYLRDLKRDADWKTILKRVGNERWQKKYLVKDYFAAMSSMLTTKELEQILQNIGIKKYTVSNGDYLLGEQPENNSENINEYEKEIDYVCVVEKT